MACDGQKLQLACSFLGANYLQIIDAFYGRATDGTVCPHKLANHTYSTGCAADRATIFNIVKNKCNAEKFCEVDVQTDILDSLTSGSAGDPCAGEFKYLEVIFKCNRHIAGMFSGLVAFSIW